MSPQDGQPPPSNVTSILAFLAAHKRGETVNELSKVLQDAVAALETLNQDHGIRKSKGAITIKITLDRDDGIYRVGIESTTKLPGIPAAKEVFWVTPQNNLVQQDPKQYRMPFVDVTRAPSRTIDAGVGAGN